MTGNVCVLLTFCSLLLTLSPTLITSQMWNVPFGSSSSLRTMLRNNGMLSSSLGDPLSLGLTAIPVTRGVVGVRNSLSPMQQEIRQRQQQLAQLQQQNAQHSLRVRTQSSGQLDSQARSRDAIPPAPFAQTSDVQQFNSNDLIGQDNMAFQRDFQQQQQQQLPRQVQRKQTSDAGLQYEVPQSVDYKQHQFPRRKISEEPQPQQLPFSQYSDRFASRVHTNRIIPSDQQVPNEANSYVTGPEPAVHPKTSYLQQQQHQSFQPREDTIPQINPNKWASEQGKQHLQQNSIMSPHRAASASHTNLVAPPIPGQQVGIMHGAQVQGQAVPTHQAVPGSPGIVYQVHPNQPQPGQQPQYSATPGVPSGPFPYVPQSGGAGGSVAQGVPAYSMANPMAMYSLNPGGMGMNMQPTGMGMPMQPTGMGMPMQPAGMGMPMQPAGMGMPMQPAGMGMPMQPAGMGMPMQPAGMGMPMSSGGMPFSNPMFGMPMGGFPFWMDMESPDSPDPVQPATQAPTPAAAPPIPALASQPVNAAPQVPQTAVAQPLSTAAQAPVPGAVALPTPLVSDGAARSAAVPAQTGSGAGAGHSQVQVQSGTPTITVPATIVGSGTDVAVQGSATSGTLPSGPASSPVHPADGAAAASVAGVAPVASNLVLVPQSHAAVVGSDAAPHTGTVASEGSKVDGNSSASNLQHTTEPPEPTTTEEYEAEEYEYEDGTTTSATTTTTIRITTTPRPTSNPMLAISGPVKNAPNSVNQGADPGGNQRVPAAPVFIYFLPKYGNSTGHDVASPVLVNLAGASQDLTHLLNIGNLFNGFSLIKPQQQLQQQHIKATSATGATVTPSSQILSSLAKVISATAIKKSSDAMATPVPMATQPTPPGPIVSDVHKSHMSPSSSEAASTSVTGSGTTGRYPKEWQNHFDYFFKLYYSLGGTSPQPSTATA